MGLTVIRCNRGFLTALVVASVLALVGLLGGCPTKSSSPEQGTAVKVDVDTGDKAADAESSKVEVTTNGETGTTTVGDKAAADDDSAAKPSETGYTDNPTDSGKLDRDGPPKGKTPAGAIWLQIDFRNARFNDKPLAMMSHLDFQAGADLDRRETVEAKFTLSDPHGEVYGELDLGFCKARIYPYVDDAQVVGMLQREVGEYSRDGRYVVMLLNTKGQAMGLFEMGFDADFHPAPPDKQPKGFHIDPRFNEFSDAIKAYHITEPLVKGQKPVVLLKIGADIGGFTTLKVTDKVGNVFSYRFPDLRVQIAPGDKELTGRP